MAQPTQPLEPLTPTDTTPSITTETHQTVVTSSPAAKVRWYGDPKFDDWMRFWWGTLIVGGFVWMVLFGQYTGKQPSNGIIEVYVAFVAGVIGFSFGSSYGSNNKAKTGL